eukprot:1195052-Prorocentrum_minimum.AAC.6
MAEQAERATGLRGLECTRGSYRVLGRTRGGGLAGLESSRAHALLGVLRGQLRHLARHVRALPL